ncbi:MAG TPA: pitrilysin family protein, partial [Dehalococcoidia bacterium]|nr:pitrilysin family protein [Dehalococcoidia bacterium]
MYQKTVLSSGLRVLTAKMPHALSVGISVYLGAGSRYERQPEAGVSHFVEHLCFKGTEKRPTPKEVAETIDRVGGVLNAATDRELTVYYAKVARTHMPLALDILTDLVCNPTFDPDEMEKERHVILEELASVEDSPGQMADLLLDATIWPDQPLGWDVGGTPESVTSISRPAALDYLQRQYVPNNAVIAVAGNVEHEEVVQLVDRTVSSWTTGSPSSWFPARDGHQARLGLRYKNTEQTHLVLAVPGLAQDHPDRQVLSLLSIILGESMSSRLFMEIRERRALAYEISSYVTHFLDTGLFSVYAAVDPAKATEAIPPMLAELAQL